MSAFANGPVRRPQPAAGPAPTIRKGRPEDDVQLTARQRDRKYLRAYGVLSVLYVALAAVTVVVFRKAVWGDALVGALQPIVGDDVYTDYGRYMITGVKWVFTVAMAILLVVPMITVLADFIRRVIRRGKFVYIESDRYMTHLLKGEADAATTQTLDYIRKELLYVNRTCGSCGRTWLVPADHQTACPNCGGRV
ncbi:hypothetical protein [Bifidobacterium saguinibicoloris]|uniref:hypothetical protein n=1 Tax=Bifidobacterium saguinibicoloris TaxID=2834433 RepID=UPI001C5765B7|nr:hypothetical protein [Bifidobacterium saguinibicoloris]MBW3081586.1 hypothetical protein [Bifidobacterium saguinibicoloris]